MKTVQTLLSVFGLVAAAQASFVARAGGYSNETIIYETVTTNVYTTYCPAATTFVGGTKTYTATASQTLTITDCPCTLTKTKTPTPTPTPTGITLPPPVVNGTVPSPVWVTTVLTAYTTYCPVPTSVVQGNQTYTVTSATTLTIKNCPCTVTYPATTASTTTLSYYTTYCPAPTTLTYGPTFPVTVPVPTPGTYTIPVISVTAVPASPPTPTAPGVPAGPTTPVVGGGSVPGTGKPVGPSATPTGPLQASNGEKTAAGFGAVVFAAFAALVL
ncbi:hypothetical protein HYFRA_00007663 [Hymenoscyphus fraxineus]|uniref:Uncharacterized protein n=1 Tax=Hymenoscyphus fraxineus TaxID=746836 RepID=A0A9N9KUM3_9HELO|nr:hypothetical protein HYFRA_00007663 [Hymenoscyphus fraxineus]